MFSHSNLWNSFLIVPTKPHSNAYPGIAAKRKKAAAKVKAKAAPKRSAAKAKAAAAPPKEEPEEWPEEEDLEGQSLDSDENIND